MTNADKRLLVVLILLLALSLCIGLMTASSKGDSVEVLTKEKITGHFMQPFDQEEYELDYFTFDEEGKPLCLTIYN